MSTHVLQLEHSTLTRVGYLDVPIPPAPVGLSAADFVDVPWREPLWSEGEKVRVGAAAWFGDFGEDRIVFDPVLAADDVLRADPAAERAHQGAIAERFASMGFPRESVDVVALSHVEGIGMVGWRDDHGDWSPFFPNARVRVGRVALRAALDSEPTPDDGMEAMVRGAWDALIALGCVDEFEDCEVLAPGLTAAVGGGHCAGHAVFHVGADARRPQATMLGHLALSPLHLATGPCPSHVEPETAAAVLRELAFDGRTVMSSLWPAPGFGRWVDGAFVSGVEVAQTIR